MLNSNLYIKAEYQEKAVNSRYKKILRFLENHEELDGEEILKIQSDALFVEEFSQCRSNIVEWLPVLSDQRVLEIHSGCGAVTQRLLQRAEKVYCVEESYVKSQICALRCGSEERLNIYVGEFSDWSSVLSEMQFDYIFVWGMEENLSDTKQFMEQLYGLLKKEGKLVLAINNKYGLKFWAGCKPTEYDYYFYKMEDDLCGFSIQRMEKVLQELNFNYDIYYPYPDYKFAFSIYSDEYLPKLGELSKNDYVFDSERMRLFDESKVYNNLITDNLFKQFSNSYLFVIEGA